VCGLGLYSPKAPRVRKGRIWTRDSASAKKESDDGVELRRKAALTCGPAVSATERGKGEAVARARAMLGLRPRPKTERGKRRRDGPRAGRGQAEAAAAAGLGQN
jgi:hypothetical protein